MSQELPEFVTIHYNTGHGYKQEKQLPTAEFIALYTDYTKKLTDIAYHFDISVFNVRHAAELLGLPSKAHYCLFRRDGYTLDLERVRQLVEVDLLDIQSAADVLGVSYYLVKKTIRENKLNVKNGHKPAGLSIAALASRRLAVTRSRARGWRCASNLSLAGCHCIVKSCW